MRNNDKAEKRNIDETKQSDQEVLPVSDFTDYRGGNVDPVYLDAVLSIKTDREVFQMTPFVLIPETPRWSNYVDIWTKIPLARS